MNSAEQRDYENKKPTQEEINESLQLIKDILLLPEMKTLENAKKNEGYHMAINILTGNLHTVGQVKWNELKTKESWAIATAAVDYLNGECNQKNLIALATMKMR